MLINLLFIITGFLGFLTLGIILTSYTFNRMINLYLIIIFILISVRFLLDGLFYLGFLRFLKDYYINFSKFLIVIIPCFYLYFKNLILDKKDLFVKKDLVHFIFPLVFLLSNVYIVNNINFYSIYLRWCFYSILFIYNSIYCFLAYQILIKNVWVKNGESRIKDTYNTLINNWTLFLFIVLVINSARLFIALYIEYSHEPNFVFSERSQCMAALIWISIFLKILISPEILFGFDVFKNKIKKEKISNLKLESLWNITSNPNINNVQDIKLKEKVDENILNYISEIERISLEFELYRNSKFSLSDMAKKIKIPNSHLNYLFKYHSKISFSDFKNNVRIHHSIRLIESDYLKTNTLDGLAKEIGFASYNPFLTNFKIIVGVSPQKYIDQLKK